MANRLADKVIRPIRLEDGWVEEDAPTPPNGGNDTPNEPISATEETVIFGDRILDAVK